MRVSSIILIALLATACASKLREVLGTSHSAARQQREPPDRCANLGDHFDIEPHTRTNPREIDHDHRAGTGACASRGHLGRSFFFRTTESG